MMHYKTDKEILKGYDQSKDCMSCVFFKQLETHVVCGNKKQDDEEAKKHIYHSQYCDLYVEKVYEKEN